MREWPGGNNGGATSPGVTRHQINVTVRIDRRSQHRRAREAVHGGRVQVNETEDDVVRTANILVEYFNKNFEFYGRKIALEVLRRPG